jgi:hypothetical protein
MPKLGYYQPWDRTGWVILLVGEVMSSRKSNRIQIVDREPEKDILIG